MSKNPKPDVDTKAHEAEGSWLDGWPAMLLSLVIISAAIYSFSPRPAPDFPATQIQADDLLITDVEVRDQRFVAVGEQGKILHADDPQGPWQLATLDQQRGSTLTRLLFVDADTVLAVGHDSWILRSTDGGETWQERLFNAEKAEPLLGISGPYDGTIYAYGAFGQLQVSEDQGKTWQRRELVKQQDEQPAEKAGGSSDPFSDDYDPFAATADEDADPYAGGNPFAGFGDGGFGFDDFSTRHLNHLIRARDGSLWLAGERGLVARSENGGETWTQFEVDYNGSFYGLIQTRSGRVMAHGMRGNIYSTPDDGKTWQRSESNTEESMFGAQILDNGDILMAGSSNVMIRSDNGGRSFEVVSTKDSDALADVLALSDKLWLTAGEAGLSLQGPAAADKTINGEEG